MTEMSNLGVTCNFSSGSSGPFTSCSGVLLKLTPPAIKNSTITCGQSGSYLQRISSNLNEISSFKLTAGFDKTTMATMRGYCTGGSTVWAKIYYPVGETWLMNCIITSFKPTDYDPTKPDVLAIELELEPAGTISFT